MSTALSTRVSQALPKLISRGPLMTFEQELEDLWNRFRTDWNGDFPLAMHAPSVDLSETDDALQLRMDVPGIKAEEINIEVSGNTLRVSGEHKEEKEEKGKTYHRLERRSGSFARAISLPAAIKEDQVCAECKDGVLTITLPKTEAAKTKQVKVIAK